MSYILSSKLSVKFANSGKKLELKNVLTEYQRILQVYVDNFWVKEELPKLICSVECNLVDTWLSARMKQCCAKQASGIVRGVREKKKRMLFVLNKLYSDGKFKQYRKLKKKYDLISDSKPEIKKCNLELDSRFVEVSGLENNTSFDLWVTVGSIGNKKTVVIPLKKSVHFNQLLERGKLKGGIRLNEKSITFMFEIESPEPQTEGRVLGIDIGIKNMVSCSDGTFSGKNKHGHDLESTITKMTLCKKGSKGYERAKQHRKNVIRWIVNHHINWTNVKQINVEDIKNLRRGKKTSRKLSLWNYRDIVNVLEANALKRNVSVNHLNPAFTSQRCSCCGWVYKGNRKLKRFTCRKCGHTADSDLNASINLSLELVPLPEKAIQRQLNRKGFYWKVVGDAPIVHPDPKTENIFQCLK